MLKIEFRGHDLRRTTATKMAEAGVPRQHISAVLNHVEGGARVTRVYDRYSYDAEKRRALETWARTLKAILEQEEPGKVLPFGAALVRQCLCWTAAKHQVRVRPRPEEQAERLIPASLTSPLLSYGTRHALGRAFERLDLQI